jgi:bisphosphoglycerate-independent phosphoglycerate mutase (AlkP superfamily)
MTEEILTDNTSAWSGDHCADVSEVSGVIFCNRPISMAEPALIDIAPTVLAQFGLKIPGSMQGRNIFQ